MKRYISTAVMLAGAFLAPAAPLTPGEALSAVLGEPPRRSGSASFNAGYRHAWTDGTGHLYAFNREGGGFLVTGADDTMPALLIGYSDSGKFDPADMPPAMRDVLGQFASGRYVSPCASHPRRKDVEPLVSAMWNQDSPFNNLCPVTSGGERAMAGCMAISMAQVMNRWRHPSCGTGTATVDFEGNELRLDLAECPFEWDDMADVYAEGEYSAAGAYAVANLVRAAGYASDMDYSAYSSGADLRTAALGMVEHLGYDRSIRSLRKSFFSTARWVGMLYDELASGRPVMYNGYGETGGHAFVCDGYEGAEGDYFHINWGWSGMSNGYFLLGNLTPGETGIGGGSGSYNSNQEAFIGIQPDKGTEHFAPFMCVYGGFGVTSASCSRTKTPEFTTVSDGMDGSSGITGGTKYRGFYNLGLVPEDVTFGIKLVNEDSGEVHHIASKEQKRMAVNQRVQSFRVDGGDFPEGEGTYMVTPAVLIGGEWSDVNQEQATLTEVTLTATETKLKFGVRPVPQTLTVEDVELSEIVNGEPVTLSARFTSVNGDFSGNVIPVLCTDRTILSHMPPCMLNLMSGESETIEWKDTFDVALAPGTYEFLIVKQDGYKIVYDGGDVEVLDRSSVKTAEYDTEAGIKTGVECYDLSGIRMADPAPGRIHIRKSPGCKPRLTFKTH